MVEIGIAASTLALSAVAGCVVWTVRVLWQLDRRVLRIETHLSIEAKETIP